MTLYDIGQGLTLRASFTDALDAPADPTTVVCQVLSPSGVTTTPAVTKDSVGHYHASLILDAAGEWWYRFDGTGAVVAAAEKAIGVRASHFV